MNKQGYIRTLEAVIAIVIMMLFIFTVINKPLNSPGKIPPLVEKSQQYILNEISFNDTLRQKVVSADISNPASTSFLDANDTLNDLILANIPPGYTYTFLICDQTTCVTTPPATQTAVYFDDLFIASYDTI